MKLYPYQQSSNCVMNPVATEEWIPAVNISADDERDYFIDERMFIGREVEVENEEMENSPDTDNGISDLEEMNEASNIFSDDMHYLNEYPPESWLSYDHLDVRRWMSDVDIDEDLLLDCTSPSLVDDCDERISQVEQNIHNINVYNSDILNDIVPQLKVIGGIPFSEFTDKFLQDIIPQFCFEQNSDIGDFRQIKKCVPDICSGNTVQSDTKILKEDIPEICSEVLTEIPGIYSDIIKEELPEITIKDQTEIPEICNDIIKEEIPGNHVEFIKEELPEINSDDQTEIPEVNKEIRKTEVPEICFKTENSYLRIGDFSGIGAEVVIGFDTNNVKEVTKNCSGDNIVLSNGTIVTEKQISLNHKKSESYLPEFEDSCDKNSTIEISSGIKARCSTQNITDLHSQFLIDQKIDSNVLNNEVNENYFPHSSIDESEIIKEEVTKVADLKPVKKYVPGVCSENTVQFDKKVIKEEDPEIASEILTEVTRIDNKIIMEEIVKEELREIANVITTEIAASDSETIKTEVIDTEDSIQIRKHLSEIYGQKCDVLSGKSAGNFITQIPLMKYYSEDSSDDLDTISCEHDYCFLSTNEKGALQQPAVEESTCELSSEDPHENVVLSPSTSASSSIVDVATFDERYMEAHFSPLSMSNSCNVDSVLYGIVETERPQLLMDDNSSKIFNKLPDYVINSEIGMATHASNNTDEDKKMKKLSVEDYKKRFPKKNYKPKPYEYNMDVDEETDETNSPNSNDADIEIVYEGYKTPFNYDTEIDSVEENKLKKIAVVSPKNVNGKSIKSLMQNVPATGFGHVLYEKFEVSSGMSDSSHYSSRDLKRYKSHSINRKRRYSRSKSRNRSKNRKYFGKRSRSKSQSKTYSDRSRRISRSNSRDRSSCRVCRHRTCRCKLYNRYSSDRSRSRSCDSQRRSYRSRSISSNDSSYSTSHSCYSTSQSSIKSSSSGHGSRNHHSHRSSLKLKSHKGYVHSHRRDGNRRKTEGIEEERENIYGKNEDFRLPSRYSQPAGSPHRPPFSQTGRPEIYDKERKVIYIEAITQGTSRENLRRRFGKFGIITDIRIFLRNIGDDYAFVSFLNHNSAARAIEHGNDNPDEPRYSLCFGERRAFCDLSYSDLDRHEEEEMGTADDIPYDSLLEIEMRRLR